MSPLRDRTVLVTGADGFIGSHLVEALLEAGARVRALCMYTSFGTHGWLDSLAPELREKLDLRLGDVRDRDLMEATCESVEVVFHLAALIGIPYSYQAPASYLETNLMGTLNLLQGVRRAGCALMVHTSTSEVYGSPDHLPITEAHPLKAQSPYSASKIAADKLCESFASSYRTPVVILRPFNTFGPRQSARAVIPTILSQLLGGRRRVRLGSLAPRRDLTYVTDTAAGFLRIAERPPPPGEVVQLGTGAAVSIGELFQRACRVLGVEAEVEVAEERVRPEASEVDELRSDPSRAREVLAWEPRVTLDEGLGRTAAWITANQDAFDVDRYAV